MFVVQCKDEIQVFHNEENANALAVHYMEIGAENIAITKVPEFSD